MAYTIESRTSNAANRLRDMLEKAERQVVVVDKDSVEEFLVSLDEIERQLDELSDMGMDARPEEARWQSLLNRLDSTPRPIVRAGSEWGGWQKLRAAHPPAESFWWRLDIESARRRQQALKRSAITVATVVGVIALAFWVMNTFFPPDPNTLLMVDATSKVEQLVLEGAWEEALDIIEETRQTLPDEPELILWEAVLAERLGDEARAARAIAEAECVLAGRLPLLWVTLGNYRMQVGDIEGASLAANRAVELDPDEAQGYFLLANVAEVNGDVPTAVDHYNRTFDLAEDNNPQIAVIAKVRLAQLLQQPAPFPTQPPIEETPSTTP